MSASAKDLAAMRNEIYQILKDNEVELTPKLHRELKDKLKSYHEHRTIEVPVEGKRVTEHHLICAKCQGVEVRFGYKGRMYAKALKANQAKTEAE